MPISKRGKLGVIAGTLLGLFSAASSHAGDIFVGVMAHDVTFLGTGSTGREASTDIQLGWRSERIGALHLIGKPSAYVILSLNTDGYTSYGGAGLAWKIGLGKSKSWYFRPGIGLVYQNGYVSLPDFRTPGLSQAEINRRVALRQHHAELGSRILFEDDFSLGRNLGNGDAMELSWAHISNGHILSSGKNQGMDDVGLRYIREF